jgi:hypothetical protein
MARVLLQEGLHIGVPARNVPYGSLSSQLPRDKILRQRSYLPEATRLASGAHPGDLALQKGQSPPPCLLTPDIGSSEERLDA